MIIFDGYSFLNIYEKVVKEGRSNAFKFNMIEKIVSFEGNGKDSYSERGRLKTSGLAGRRSTVRHKAPPTRHCAAKHLVS